VPKPKLDLVKVKALAAFTVSRPYGHFHGDPASESNAVVDVPADALNAREDLLGRNKVEVVAEAPADAEPVKKKGGRPKKEAPADAGPVKAGDDAGDQAEAEDGPPA
jgi:hypothetical protein